jgi:hypothetical protein
MAAHRKSDRRCVCLYGDGLRKRALAAGAASRRAINFLRSSSLMTACFFAFSTKPGSSNMPVQWQNPVGLSRTIIGNLSGYVEFYNAVSTGQHQPRIGTLDTGLIYQVTPNFFVDADLFFGLNHSAPDYNVFVGFGRRF